MDESKDDDTSSDTGVGVVYTADGAGRTVVPSTRMETAPAPAPAQGVAVPSVVLNPPSLVVSEHAGDGVSELGTDITSPPPAERDSINTGSTGTSQLSSRSLQQRIDAEEEKIEEAQDSII